MITTYLIQHHDKALKILSAIELATTYNRSHKWDIAQLSKLEFWDPARANIDHYQNRIKINDAIIERLTKYYVRLEQKRNEVIMSKNIAA